MQKAGFLMERLISLPVNQRLVTNFAKGVNLIFGVSLFRQKFFTVLTNKIFTVQGARSYETKIWEIFEFVFYVPFNTVSAISWDTLIVQTLEIM